MVSPPLARCQTPLTPSPRRRPPPALQLSGAIYGELYVNSRLSGMPDLTLSFSNVGMLDDVRFHPCAPTAPDSPQTLLAPGTASVVLFSAGDGPEELLRASRRCVRYARYSADRVLSFVPPDGAARQPRRSSALSRAPRPVAARGRGHRKGQAAPACREGERRRSVGVR